MTMMSRVVNGVSTASTWKGGGVELRWSGRDDEAHLVVGALLDDVEQGTMHVLLLVLLGDLRPSLSNRSQFFQNLLANRRIRHTELS